jgi:hypothetical protein
MVGPRSVCSRPGRPEALASRRLTRAEALLFAYWFTAAFAAAGVVHFLLRPLARAVGP